MRRLGVCLLVAVGALVTPALIQARLPVDKPPAAPHGKPPRPDKAPPKKSPSSNTGWLWTVNDVCMDGLRDRTALLADVSQNPSSTARKTLLRILAGTALVEERMLRRLTRVRAPRGDRAAFRGALHLFRDRHAEDKRLVAALKRGWNARRLERQTRRDRVLNTRLVRLWNGLGAAACSKYFRSLG